MLLPLGICKTVEEYTVGIKRNSVSSYQFVLGTPTIFLEDIQILGENDHAVEIREENIKNVAVLSNIVKNRCTKTKLYMFMFFFIYFKTTFKTFCRHIYRFVTASFPEGLHS